MTRKRSNVARSVRTDTFVRTSPFRKGTAREKAFFFLLEKERTLDEFSRWAKKIGVNGRSLLRMFRERRYPVFVESEGMISIRE